MKYTRVTIETMEDASLPSVGVKTDGVTSDGIDGKSQHTGEPMLGKVSDYEGVLITTKNGRTFKRKLSSKDAAALAAEVDAALQSSDNTVNF